jgi:uncharacterized protein
MIPDGVRHEIMRRIRRAEAEHGVRVLLAIESGSRAWGFASSDSDYDARFIYAHAPDWYHAVDLEERRDVIEYPILDEIDLNGWDVRKALRLFWKSNPAFVEWIQSPIGYLETGCFRAASLALLPQVYSPEKGIHHYLSMARSNYRGHLREPQVRLKKYFYVLRPLLAARWIARSGQAAPIEFERLLDLLDGPGEDQVRQAVERLLEHKRNATERGLAAAVPVLNAFIETALAVAPGAVPRKSHEPAVVGALNGLFQRVLAEQ